MCVCLFESVEACLVPPAFELLKQTDSLKAPRTVRIYTEGYDSSHAQKCIRTCTRRKD